MGESRGSIAFFATYRPPVPLDIFSCPIPPSSRQDELHLTDGVSYNYNCRPIPPAALKTLIKRPKLASEGGATEADVDAGRVSGLVFVSERDDSLETLYVALRFNTDNKVKVVSLADIFGAADFSDTRMEDSGCIGGGYKVGSRTVDHSLIYVSTKEPVQERRSPWTVVYKTNLRTGKTERLTPKGAYDLSPAVSPSGKKVAVASFQGKGWEGEIEDLQTDIYVMNVEKPPLERKRLIKNGGWPTWASDNVLFFHRKVGEIWGVFRYTVTTGETVRVTPEAFDAVTPAAISETKVAVATIRQKSKFSDVRVEAQYRHIEIFDTTAPEQPVQITQKMRPKADHFNPFVIDGGSRVGYHRSRSDLLQKGDDIPRNFHKLQSPVKDVGLFRVSGVFPTISKDGSKLAFVDNEFKAVWVADSQGLRIVYETKGPDSIFSPMWNQNPDKDILYVCMGPSFNAGKPLEICAIPNASSGARQRRQLTKGKFNNAFPSSDPDGTKFVFRSTRDGGDNKHKNLYIMENAEVGEYGDGTVTRLTNGPWTDTHCQWSPNGDWIVFSSTRDKPKDAPELDNGLDPGYFAVFLVKASDPTVVIRGDEEWRRSRRAREPPGVQPGRPKHRRNRGPRRRVRRPDLAAAVHSLGEALRRHLRSGHRPGRREEEQGCEEVPPRDAQPVRVLDAGVDHVRDGRPERAVERAGEGGRVHAGVPLRVPRRGRELAHDRPPLHPQKMLLNIHACIHRAILATRIYLLYLRSNK